jgi:predicted nucleic acid-binding protein
VQSFDAFLGFLADGTVRIANEEQVIRSALLLALSSGHKMPDCVYLALAEHERVGLFTADLRLTALAEERGVPTTLLTS